MIMGSRIWMVASIVLMGLMACDGDKRLGELERPGVSRELADFRKANFKEVRYDLRFSIPEERVEPVTGQVTVAVTIEEDGPLILDFRNGEVRSLSLNGDTVPYRVADEHVVIDKEYVRKGDNLVSLSFVSADQSLNRRDDLLYTLLVPDRARTVFPCFDQPNMKSRFSLTLELPRAWEAVSNGAIREIDSLSVEGRKRISFAETEPLSTYLFSFVAGRLERERFERDGREISIYHRETDPKKRAQCPDIADEVFDALAWQEAFTGIDYPFAKYDLIILPGFQFGGMEHTGATLYNDRRIFLDEHPTLDDRLGRSALIAHETSHMWFGDYVTMDWFDDVWTKEVFANYFASRIVEPLYPEVDHRLNFISDYVPSAYAEDRTAGSNPIKQKLDNLSDAGLVYGNIIYNKSPMVMEMLVRMLGEEAFRKGIREYLTTYAYGNATWEGLIRILDQYTDEDLEAWSRVWVHEKGMPELSASVSNGRLIVTQRDPWGRGLLWPQRLSYLVRTGDKTEVVDLEMTGSTDRTEVGLTLPVDSSTVVIPNRDGRGYGFFRVGEAESSALWQEMRRSDDALLKGSLLITLYENLCRSTISPQAFSDEILAYLPQEKNALLYSMALGYLGKCQARYDLDARPAEAMLWRIVTSDPDPVRRSQAFRLYRSVAESDEATQRLYRIWKEQVEPANCPLSERDYINLSYTLALRMPDQSDAIVAEQRTRITNPDRLREYDFISPAVSPDAVRRDSVFAALLIAENRRVEPWASSALSFLNDRSREAESVKYIRPALEAMPEIQRTGDIFFPKSWAGALLGNHHSEAARHEVEAFFAAHPDFPVMLGNKIKQQADFGILPGK